MSDRAYRRQPATLPEGYQYGDAVRPGVRLFLSPLVLAKLLRWGKLPNMHEMYREYREFAAKHPLSVGDAMRWHDDPIIMCSCENWMTCEHPWPQSFQPGWRAPHENAAAQLSRRCASAVQQGGSSVPCDCQRTGEETV